jgi:hypothetical protein
MKHKERTEPCWHKVDYCYDCYLLNKVKEVAATARHLAWKKVVLSKR